jgi:hypothetical protein
MLDVAQPWFTKYEANAKTCHDCSGNFASACSNRDCGLFYARKKTAKQQERFKQLLPLCTW